MLAPTQIVVGESRYRRGNGWAAVAASKIRVVPWTPAHDVHNAQYAAARRLSAAVNALSTSTSGWGYKLPKDVPAALALAEVIESYLRETP